MSTIKENYGSRSTLTITGLASMATSTTVGWESDIVDNRSSVLAIDYEINVKFPMAATAAASTATLYIYLIPWMWDGSAWVPGADLGTATPFAGAQGGATRSSSGLNAKLIAQLLYITTGMTLSGQFNVLDAFSSVPDGWSLFIVDDTGAAMGASPIIAYRPLYLDVV